MRELAPGWFELLNAGKESVVCDLKRDPALGRALCARADVVLEGFRPGVAARLGVGPGDLPDTVVYCSLTGFGAEGRHAQRAGHDVNYLGWAGALWDTAPGIPPVQAADVAAGGLAAVVEILAALYERSRTGLGRHVVVSMTHGAHRFVSHRLGGDPLPRLLTGGLACYGIYATADRASPHPRRARGALLRTGVRAARPAGARLPPVRRGRPGGAGGGARRRLPGAAARRLARALRRRGRLRRPRGDARGGGSRSRRDRPRRPRRRRSASTPRSWRDELGRAAVGAGYIRPCRISSGPRPRAQSDG